MHAEVSKNIEMRKGEDLLVAVGLIIVALVMRVYGLWESPFSGDEWYTMSGADQRYKSLVNPAYYALVAGTFKVFGVSEWSVRLPAVVLGVLAIPIFFLTWRSVIGRNAALIGALLIILSSWHLWYSQFGRFYSGVFLFGSLSYFLYYRAVQLDSIKYLALALLFNALAALFHLSAVLVAASFALYALFVVLRGRWIKRPDEGRVARLFLAICLVAAPLAAYLGWPVLAGWHSSAQAWGYGPIGLTLQIVKYVQLPVAACALFGIVLMLYTDVQKAAFLAIGIGLPACILVGISSIMAARPDYMFFAIPLAYAASGYACEQVRLALRDRRVGGHALTAIVVVSMLPELISHYTGKATLDIREVVAFVDNAYRPGDRILNNTGFSYYSRREIQLEPWFGNPYNDGKDWKAVLKPYAASAHRTWIILPIRRGPLAKGLETWLLSNARLVWRRYSKRFDYTFDGYQVFLVDEAPA